MCRMGALQYGVRHVSSRNRMNWANAFGKVRDFDSMATRAPPAGLAYRRRRATSPSLSRLSVISERATSAEGLDKVTFRPTGRGGWQIHIVYKRGHGGNFCGSEWDVDAKTLFDAWEAAGE